VIGCAPTALFELIEHAEEFQPRLVIGLPVGFVGAVESKRALRERADLPSVSNVSGKGGSAVAAAALNALLYQEIMLYQDTAGIDTVDFDQEAVR
jgi:precorrin-8X/cobalt-precorrin-8 methylmutase